MNDLKPSIDAAVEEHIRVASELSTISKVGFTGDSGGKLVTVCDVTLSISSKKIARNHESHILVGHTQHECIDAYN